MTVTAKLVFKQHIPFRLENELCTERGFHVVYRLHGGGACLQKGFESEDEELEWMCNENDVPWEDHPSDNDDEEPLSKARKKEIEKKCERIYDSFIDPYRQTDDIKDTLRLMCIRSRYTAAETEFVDNWIWANVI